MSTKTESRVLIIEDEYSIALDMEMRLQKMGYTIVGIAGSYNDALPLLMEDQADVALLDINIKGEKNGIELGKLILSKFNIPILFVTAYADSGTFSEAMEAKPMGYITKPFKDADLHHSIQLALQNFIKEEEAQEEYHTDSQNLFIKDKGVIHQVATTEILWIEAMDNYTLVHTKEKKLIVHAFLKDVLRRLGANFIRIHRSHAVALDKITTLEDNVVYIGDTFLIIGQNYRNDLISRMNLL